MIELPARRLLLAGSAGPERVPARPGTSDPRWFEPLHVRDAGGARARIAEQVAAGADIVAAPAWLTHRRALMRVGESRRARAWSMLAVEVAREGVEAGLERRVERPLVDDDVDGRPDADPADGQDDRRDGDVDGREGEPANDAGDDGREAPIPRPDPLVAGVLPRLDAEPETDAGRLAPAEVATERDYRDQAGLLTDADVDLLLLEGVAAASARSVIGAVASLGLPVWVAAPPEATPRDPGAESLRRWAEIAFDAGAARVLGPIGPSADDGTVAWAAGALAATGRDWGAQLGRGTGLLTTATAWLEHDAGVLAILDGATPAALATARAALRAHERGAWAVVSRARRRWRTLVSEAAAMAPGGEALWIGTDPGDGWRPPGFAWLEVPPEELGRLPLERYRLIVDTTGRADPVDASALLERGGVLVASGDGPIVDIDEARLLRVEDSATPMLTVRRREP